MKIDSLLNPSADEAEYTTPSPYSTHATISSSSQSGYAPSPGYPPSPNNAYYNHYQGYHDTSPGAVSAANTHGSSPGSIHMNPYHQPPQTLQQHHHHHHMFLSYKPGPRDSTHSSPDPYHPRERFDSVSSGSSANGTERRRPPRPKYEEEEMYFIWYHRVDLCQEWKEVRESFNRQFPNRQRCGFQGIQCKFYRFIKEKQCPTLREQRRMRDGEFLREGAALGNDSSGAPRFGVVEWANVWYPWMREDRETAMGNRERMLST